MSANARPSAPALATPTLIAVAVLILALTASERIVRGLTLGAVK